MYASYFQIQALWLHYRKGTPFPGNVPYRQVANDLLSLLGQEKLERAIALIPNNKDLSYEQAGAQLPVLDLWHTSPELFQEMGAAEINRLQDESPEQLYADGECDLVVLDGKVYRYWKDSLEDF